MASLPAQKNMTTHGTLSSSQVLRNDLRMTPQAIPMDDDIQFVSSNPVKKKRGALTCSPLAGQHPCPPPLLQTPSPVTSAGKYAAQVQVAQSLNESTSAERCRSTVSELVSNAHTADSIAEHRGLSLPGGIENFRFPTTFPPSSHRLSEAISPKQTHDSITCAHYKPDQAVGDKSSAAPTIRPQDISCLDFTGLLNSDYVDIAAMVPELGHVSVQAHTTMPQDVSSLASPQGQGSQLPETYQGNPVKKVCETYDTLASAQRYYTNDASKCTGHIYITPAYGSYLGSSSQGEATGKLIVDGKMCPAERQGLGGHWDKQHGPGSPNATDLQSILSSPGFLFSSRYDDRLAWHTRKIGPSSEECAHTPQFGGISWTNDGARAPRVGNIVGNIPAEAPFSSQPSESHEETMRVRTVTPISAPDWSANLGTHIRGHPVHPSAMVSCGTCDRGHQFVIPHHWEDVPMPVAQPASSAGTAIQGRRYVESPNIQSTLKGIFEAQFLAKKLPGMSQPNSGEAPKTQSAEPQTQGVPAPAPIELQPRSTPETVQRDSPQQSPPVPKESNKTRKHAANLYVDIAETVEEIFPFEEVAKRHGTSTGRVVDAVKGIIQLPLLRCQSDKRRAGPLAMERMQGFREAKRARLATQTASD